MSLTSLQDALQKDRKQRERNSEARHDHETRLNAKELGRSRELDVGPHTQKAEGSEHKRESYGMGDQVIGIDQPLAEVINVGRPDAQLRKQSDNRRDQDGNRVGASPLRAEGARQDDVRYKREPERGHTSGQCE